MLILGLFPCPNIYYPRTTFSHPQQIVHSVFFLNRSWILLSKKTLVCQRNLEIQNVFRHLGSYLCWFEVKAIRRAVNNYTKKQTESKKAGIFPVKFSSRSYSVQVRCCGSLYVLSKPRFQFFKRSVTSIHLSQRLSWSLTRSRTIKINDGQVDVVW